MVWEKEKKKVKLAMGGGGAPGGAFNGRSLL